MKEEGKIYKAIEVIKTEVQYKEDESIFSFINDIFNNDCFKEKYLLVGEVQSGKTKAIIKIINHAISVGYDYVIVLGGTTNLLNNQTFERLGRDVYNTINGRLKKIIMPDAIKKGLINFFRTGSKFFYVFCFLKGKDALDNIFNNFIDQYHFSNKKILIIDDETDFASVNTKKSGSESRIHNSINKLYSSIAKGRLIQVTATPFANILTNTADPLYFNKIILLNKNNEYTGSQFFLNSDVYQIVKAQKNDEQKWKRAIEETVCCYLLSTVLYKRVDQKCKTECLINIDSFTPLHKQARDHVLKTLIKIKEYEGFNDWFESVLKKRFPKCEIDKEKVSKQINDIVDQICEEDSIFLLNQNNKYESGYSTYSIVIGGILISRGVTFHNLLTELILNASSEKNSIDTLLQRARWFGYRLDHTQYRYMTVYLNKEIYQSLKESNDAIVFFEKHYTDTNLKNLLIQFEKKHLKATKLTGKPKIQLRGK